MSGHTTGPMWLVYADDDGGRHYQPWQDLTEAGTLINEFGNDMEMIGWTTVDPDTPPRVVERELTITVVEHGWTTYRFPVSPDFDTSEAFAVEDAFVNTDVDELVALDGAVEHREITVDADERIGS